MSKIFLTDGSGFVGQYLIPQLLRQGYQVVALCRSSRAAEKVSALGAAPVMDDLTHLSQAIAAALKSCAVVVHSAAYIDFNYDRDKFFAINVVATKSLLRLAKENGVKRFLYLSAAPVVPGSPIKNLTEDQAAAGLPRDLYPRTKALAEKAVLVANEAGFLTLALRPPAIWGPDNHHLEEVLDRVRAGQWRWIGGGHQVLSTIHINNLVAAILAALERGRGGEAYFVTDGDQRSMRTSFSAIFRAHGLEPTDKEFPLGLATFLARGFDLLWRTFGIKSRPPIPPLAIRLMAQEFSVSDAKARRELNYQNVIHFEEGIKKINPSISPR